MVGGYTSAVIQVPGSSPLSFGSDQVNIVANDTLVVAFTTYENLMCPVVSVSGRNITIKVPLVSNYIVEPAYITKVLTNNNDVVTYDFVGSSFFAPIPTSRTTIRGFEYIPMIAYYYNTETDQYIRIPERYVSVYRNYPPNVIGPYGNQGIFIRILIPKDAVAMSGEVLPLIGETYSAAVWVKNMSHDESYSYGYGSVESDPTSLTRKTLA